MANIGRVYILSSVCLLKMRARDYVAFAILKIKTKQNKMRQNSRSEVVKDRRPGAWGDIAPLFIT